MSRLKIEFRTKLYKKEVVNISKSRLNFVDAYAFGRSKSAVYIQYEQDSYPRG